MAKRWKLFLFGGIILAVLWSSNSELYFQYGPLIDIIPLCLVVFGIVQFFRYRKIKAEEEKRRKDAERAAQEARQREADRLKAEQEARMAAWKADLAARQAAREKEAAEISARRAGTVSQEYPAAGVAKHQSIFRKYGSVNPEYKMSARELQEDGVCYDIYQYDFSGVELSLEREPDNPVDPNAVKVLMEGELIGYIPKESAPHVSWLMDNDRIVDCEVRVVGGPLKRYDPLEETYERVPLHFGVRITLYVRPEDADGQ